MNFLRRFLLLFLILICMNELGFYVLEAVFPVQDEPSGLGGGSLLFLLWPVVFTLLFWQFPAMWLVNYCFSLFGVLRSDIVLNAIWIDAMITALWMTGVWCLWDIPPKKSKVDDEGIIL